MRLTQRLFPARPAHDLVDGEKPTDVNAWSGEA
jgi:hypothetical protein